jgi:PAS domain-containing protein
LKANASDFLIKGGLTRLVPAIRREMRNARARREWQRAEDAVQQMQDRFQALIENAPDGIALIDNDNHVQFASPAGRKKFGYSPDEDPEINPAEQIHPDDLPKVLPVVSNLVEHPK